jgi:alkylation response protein AidB-like acyl-CoA dehydrogenase
MAEHGFGAAFAINNLQGSVTRLSRAGTDIQHSELMEASRSGQMLWAPAMTEPAGGSDLSALSTSATRADGGWLVSGTKDWVTNGLIVNAVTLLAQVAGADGNPEIASFLAVLDEASTVRREKVVVPGAEAFRLARLTFDNHFIPDWALFSEPGQALKSSLAAINAARVHVAAMAVASLHAALKEAVAYAGRRKAFGKTLLEHQGLRWELAEVAIRLEAANALVFKAARLVNDGEPALTAAAQAKKYSLDTAIWGIDQCMRAMGAAGALGSHRLGMLFSEVRMGAYGDGTNEMLLDRIGRNLSKDYEGPVQNVGRN